MCSVSRSTVAAVLRNKPSTAAISEATRQKVLAAARQLSYRPHAAAFSLRTRRTHTIAIAVPYLPLLTGTITGRILQGVGQRAQSLGYDLNICSYQEGPEARTTFTRLFRESRYDGVLFYGDSATGHDDPREIILSELEVPHVVLEKSARRSVSIAFDNIAGAQQAVAHLASTGHRRIAYVGNSETVSYCRERLQGYRQALAAAGLKFDPQLVFRLHAAEDADYVACGRSAAMANIQRQVDFDAAFCVCDATALGMIQTLLRHGARVPEDVAVVGFDDSMAAALATPSLTTVRQDGVAMGQEAVNLLHTLINGHQLENQAVRIPVKLIVRESSGASASIDSTFHHDASRADGSLS